MMNDALTREGIKFLIARLLENANDAVEESKKDKNDQFAAGRRLAYYEMLDILKTELDIKEQDLKDFGLDVNLENKIA
ncbi:MAG: transposase [Fusicatenibacter sp.]|nr:transposase [Fusicatenibacter sp.]